MSTSKKQKHQADSQRSASTAQQSKRTAINPTPSPTLSKVNKWHIWIYPLILAILTILIYKNTFEHRFVLDDHGIIKNNKITKAPVSWENTKTIFSTPLRKGDFSDLENSLYRPAVKMLFNLEWNLFDGDAHLFHVVNVLIYALSGILLFFVLYDAMKRNWVLPFLVTLLFLTHPIHTEVVANVKSADEIMSLLGILLALRGIQLYISTQQMVYIIGAVLGYLLGSFSKESTVVAVAIVPVFMYFFTKASWRQLISVSVLMFACSLFFLACRHFSLSGYPPESPVSALDNFMVLCKDPAYAGTSAFASAIATIGLYIKTFLFPHPLSCDYSYSTLVPVGFGDTSFILTFLLLAGMIYYSVRSVLPIGEKDKPKHTIAFGLLWFFISMSITSNVFFLIGTSFGERLFYVPSLGLIIAIVAALKHYLWKGDESSFMAAVKQAPVLFGLVLLVAGLFSFKTIERNNDWKSDFGLFSRDIEYFPNSTHLLFYLGNHLSGDEFKQFLEYKVAEENAQIDVKDSLNKASMRAVKLFNRALSIYPALPSDGYNQLGKAYYNLGEMDSAYKYYMRAHDEDSTNPIFTNNLGTTFYNSSIPLSTKAEQFQRLGMMDSAQYYARVATDKLLSALPYFLKAHQGDSTETDFINNVGCIYGATQRPDSAIYWFNKAYKTDSLDLISIQFLDITYRALGKTAEADYYKARAAQVRQIRTQQFE